MIKVAVVESVCLLAVSLVDIVTLPTLAELLKGALHLPLLIRFCIPANPARHRDRTIRHQGAPATPCGHSRSAREPILPEIPLQIAYFTWHLGRVYFIRSRPMYCH